MKRLSALPLLLLAALSPAQKNPVVVDNFLVTDQDVFFVAPPISLLDTTVLSAQWSPTGRHLIVRQGMLPRDPDALKALLFPTAPPNLNLEVAIVDAVTGDRKTVYRFNPSTQFVSEIAWCPDGSKAILVTSGTSDQILLVDVESGEQRLFSPWGQDPCSRVQISVSPSKRETILIVQLGAPNDAHKTVRGYAFVGDSSREIVIPRSDVGFPNISWSEDGLPVAQTWVKSTVDESVTPKLSLLSLTGADPKEIADFKSGVKQPALFTQLQPSVVDSGKDGEARGVDSGWLKASSAQREVLVAANASWIDLSPSANQVAYIAEGALFVRPLIRMDLATFDRIQSEEARRLAMNRAKTVGVAAMIFSTDNDDLVPGPRDFEEKLSPYMKDPEIMKSFVWTYAGGNLAEMENPASVELGYIALPGGRCVLYADTHIRWIPNP